MDAEQLWETTLNPETRMMKRVEIEDARLASSVTEILMGSDVPPRKKFIYEHAQDAELEHRSDGDRYMECVGWRKEMKWKQNRRCDSYRLCGGDAEILYRLCHECYYLQSPAGCA